MLKLNKYSKQIIAKALLVAIFMLFGMLTTNQYTLYKRLGFMKSISDPNGQALRISQVYAATEKLKQQLNEENQKKDELTNSATNSGDLESILKSDKNKYEILSGKTEVQGEGTRITIEHLLVQTQLIDFINALKNIGSEGMSINGTRIVGTTPIGQFANQSNYEIDVIGNKDTLYDSVTRAGGAFDLIVSGKAQKMDNLILPAVK